MFKKATIDDLDVLLPLCEKHFHMADMTKRGYSFDYESAKITLSGWLTNPMVFIIYSKHGLIAFVRTVSLFNRNEFYWAELLWYAEDAREMRKLFEYFMEKYGYGTVRVGVPVKGSLTRFLRRRGFVLTELSFLRHNI